MPWPGNSQPPNGPNLDSPTLRDQRAWRVTHPPRWPLVPPIVIIGALAVIILADLWAGHPVGPLHAWFPALHAWEQAVGRWIVTGH